MVIFKRACVYTIFTHSFIDRNLGYSNNAKIQHFIKKKKKPVPVPCCQEPRIEVTQWHPDLPDKANPYMQKKAILGKRKGESNT